MKCNHCNQREANLEIRFNIQGQKAHMQLCHTCYNEIKQELYSSNGQPPFNNGFSSFNPFFTGNEPNSHNMKQSMNTQQQHGRNGGGILDSFGRNLTDAAKAGLIDPVIGRDKEIARVTEILNRRNKNNPVLIGEPGVGKTAIAEGLALKIIEGNVPSKIQNKEVYLLDVASLVSDTGIRGQFEERMKQLISELQQRKNVILFIDEIHQLVGAGSAQGSMDAGNILKPALARGELQVLGATTLKEYRDIEKDAALERRLQPVMVNEPTVEETITILKGLQDKYEQFHEVSFSEEAIEASAKLSHRYIQDRFLPDKAIDLMDEAGSKMNLQTGGSIDESIQSRLDDLAKEKEKCAKEENYERAAKLRKEEIELEKKLTADSNSNKSTITVEDIQYIIETKTGIPVRKLQHDEQAKMKDLDKKLNAKVIGQEEAVRKVTKAVRRSRAGLKQKTRPIGSFLFVGPTGVGKTELSKSLAEELFGDKEAMIRLDMSEYMEKHSVSKLIGSPPGYVGHDEAGQLTEQIRHKPYSIILLDEIEKAHPDVQHMFLQILEDGRLTDSQGRTVSFKDSVIIMTSNAGVQEKKKSLGFTSENYEQESTILESLGAFFKPEFLNRFDNIIEFNALEQEHLIKIVDLLLTDLNEQLTEQEIEITFTDEVKKDIAKRGYHPAFGARPLRRVIQEQLEDKIADVLLDTEGHVHTLVADVTENEITIAEK
ncbi:ATP-dependent Clp protease ATP-binding subunit [Bacillus solimangrovi]|uniref:ATP-dependent Clp protease ATP-binding subunit n=1 Tax=Bacillus solimangrovi TaxID=1305675 RepID=A0A1E5LJH6_9BACI|nr:ATP-dependent Clp protease ATP-binding subunit [Bacillus solimangrovi]OEH94234.1 ATP-dependent Clp protease ATP-binding subunit [Bacillus solimangrovi]